MALRKCYAEQPDSLIIDLSGLDDPAAASANVWMTAQRAAAATNPPIRLALCVPASLALAGRLQSLGVRRYLPVYARVQQARVALAGGLPLTDRLVLKLPPVPDSPGRAGGLVADACRSWRMRRLEADARAVVTELVHNAVEHAGTEITVRIARREAGVNIVVADRDPRLPRLLDCVGQAGRGRGLRLVHTTASRWGAMPTAGGKAVWATVAGRRVTAPR